MLRSPCSCFIRESFLLSPSLFSSIYMWNTYSSLYSTGPFPVFSLCLHHNTHTANGLHFPLCSFPISIFSLSYCWSRLIWMENRSFLSLSLAAGCLLDQGLLLFHLQTRQKRGISSVTWLNSFIAAQPFGFAQNIIKRTMGGRKGTREIEER